MTRHLQLASRNEQNEATIADELLELASIARGLTQAARRLERIARGLQTRDDHPRRLDAGVCLVLAQDAVDTTELTSGRLEVALAESLWRVLRERDLIDE